MLYYTVVSIAKDHRLLGATFCIAAVESFLVLTRLQKLKRTFNLATAVEPVTSCPLLSRTRLDRYKPSHPEFRTGKLTACIGSKYFICP